MACDQSKWSFSEGGLDESDVRALLDHHFAEMCAISPPEACNVLAAEDLRDPAIRFFTARDGESALVGFGAIKTLDHNHAEIKSMRTAPHARGRGVGKAVLDHLLLTARAMGMIRVSLETGNGAEYDPANRLYLSRGFERCGSFGNYADTPFTHFYTRLI